MKTTILVLLVASILTACGGGGSDSATPTSGAAPSTPRTTAAVPNATEWPVSLLLARALSRNFQVENSSRFQAFGSEAESNATARESNNGGQRWYWKMESGHLVLTNHVVVGGSATHRCLATSNQQIPYYAMVGASGAALQCAAETNTLWPDGKVEWRTIAQSNLRWEVIESKQPGKVLICLRGGAGDYGCVRGDQEGKVDESFMPWDDEASDAYSAAQWPVSLIVARGLSTRFEQLRGTAPYRPEDVGDRCTATTTASGGETVCVNFTPIGASSVTYTWEMHAGQFALVNFRSGSRNGFSECATTQNRIDAVLAQNTGLSINRAYFKPSVSSDLPFYASIGDTSLALLLGGQCLSLDAIFQSSAPAAIVTRVKTSKKPGHVLVCLRESFCYRADVAGNIDVSKFPWQDEEPADPAVPPSGPDWPVSLILGRGLSTLFEELRGAPPLQPNAVGDRCSATVSETGGETICSTFNPISSVSDFYRWEMRNGHFALITLAHNSRQDNRPAI
jgi:hypothetical protein